MLARGVRVDCNVAMTLAIMLALMFCACCGMTDVPKAALQAAKGGAETYPVVTQLPQWYLESNQTTLLSAFGGKAPLQDSRPIDTTDPDTWLGQAQEDLFAYRHFFYGKKNGFFLEMGAFDGKEISNTLKLETALGWRGMLIEPEPANFAKLIVNRPNAICVNVAVCDKVKKVHFVVGHTVTSGILEFMSPSFIEQWLHDVDIEALPELTCMPLDMLLQRFHIHHLNLFSLDVEGGELAVLESLDFNKLKVDVMVIEQDAHNSEKNEAVRRLLKGAGYTLYQRSHHNEWFLRPGFVPSRDPTLDGDKTSHKST